MSDRQKVLNSFSKIVKRILGKNLSKIIVYGSFARGDYTETSDIDIMILTTFSQSEIEQIENQIFDLAYDFELEYGIVINPVLENESHFNYWLGALPFYNNVKKEGVIIG